MKVAIATVYDSANLGSYLQALGMQELVKQHGDEPYFVKTRSCFSSFGVFTGYNNAKSVRSLKSFIKYLYNSFRHPTSFKKNFKKYRTYKKDWSSFEHIYSIRKSDRIKPDVLLLGSDEIWNSNQPAFRNELLYGEGIKAKRKYGYAVSLGNMDKLNWKKYPQLLKNIKKLDGVIVRDKRTEELLHENGIEILSSICDPTLQVDIKSYMRDDKNVDIPNENYIVVYTYRISKKMKENIKQFAHKNSLKTIAVSLQQPWCDEYINCSPLEFGAVLKNAKYVYTSTFHGTIFSVLYRTQFVSLNTMPKVLDVMKLIGVEGFGITEECEYEEFEKKITAEHNYTKVEKRIIQIRNESVNIYNNYIKRNI